MSIDVDGNQWMLQYTVRLGSGGDEFIDYEQPPVTDRHATVAYLALLLAGNRYATLVGVLESAYEAGREAGARGTT